MRRFRVTRFRAAGELVATEYLSAWTHEEALREYAQRHIEEGFNPDAASVTGNPGATSNCLVDPHYPMGGVVAFRA